MRDFNDAPEHAANSTGNNPSTLEDAGNGFLMRYGYTVVWSGWQGDILPGNHRLTMRLPVATDEGRDLTGLVRTELTAEQPNVRCLPLSGNDYTLSYQSVSLDTAAATLTCREHEGDVRLPIASHAWQFARVDARGTVVPSTTHCYVPAGFTPGWLYELIYTARNPLVLGLGFTGVRDLVSFLLHADADAMAPRIRCTTMGRVWKRPTPGAFRRAGAFCASLCIVAIMPMRRGGGYSMQSRRMSQVVDG